MKAFGMVAAVIGAVLVGLYILGSSVEGGSSASKSGEGMLAEKTLGCFDSDTLSKAQERLNTNNDWMPAAGLIAQGQCFLFEPGDRWRLIERAGTNSLVYVTKNSVPRRVFVRASKLRT